MTKADKATRARSFGAVADVYDRGRPGWPAEATRWLLGPEPLEVLDLGAGTGKLTAALLAAGHRVTALEPSAGMREVLAERLASGTGADEGEAARDGADPASGGKGPPVVVIDGRAEEIPLADGSVDAVVAGSAFHWFDREPTLAEVFRVLRPPGVFGLLGNRYDTSIDWQRRLRKVSSAGMIYRGDHWPRQPELRERFAEVEDRSIAHRMEVDPAMLRDYLSSLSWVATMEPAEREAKLAAIDEFWASEPELRDRASATLVWRSDVRRARGVRS
ncbi:MAG TPA: class I SAM-dependent methyltransferase [Solirubrobacterales bacterium]|nr:class I SAM-dependent methyltransferase [Solirubrobacterales bacterium]